MHIMPYLLTLVNKEPTPWEEFPNYTKSTRQPFCREAVGVEREDVPDQATASGSSRSGSAVSSCPKCSRYQCP